MDSETITRPDRLTLDRWERLPWLIPRAVVIEWTGLSKRELEGEIQAGRLRVFKAVRKRKFYKAEIAELAGMPAPHGIGRNRAQSGAIVTRPLDSGVANSPMDRR